MKILLLGKNGQVGSQLSQTLLPLGQLIALGRQELNLEHTELIQPILEQHKPEIIVNAAAYTAVDKAEQEENKAYVINTKAVGLLADYAIKNNVLLVHYSTDYVFDGKKEGLYTEQDKPNPLNVYGASKRAGELAILHSDASFLIFRTSWVFSQTGTNFISTILQLAQEKSSLQVVCDQYGIPTPAELIAKLTAHSILSFYKKQLRSGLYHLTSSGITNRHDFACFIVKQAKAYGLELKLNVDNIEAIHTQDFPAAALRPQNSGLDNKLISKTLKTPIDDWSVYAEQMMKQLTQGAKHET